MNFIQYERHAIISKSLIVFLLHYQSSFDIEKTVARQRVQILLLHKYMYLVAMLVSISHSLNFYDVVIKNRLTDIIQDISHFIR